MKIILYKITDPPKKVVKNLKNSHEIDNVRFIFEMNALAPTTIVDRKDFQEVADWSNYNYMYIPQLHRYYFISEIKTFENKIHISGDVDVLYTYRKSILNSEQLIKRSESLKNRMLSDDMLPIHADNSHTLRVFGETISDETGNRIVLQTNGHATS